MDAMYFLYILFHLKKNENCEFLWLRVIDLYYIFH